MISANNNLLNFQLGCTQMTSIIVYREIVYQLMSEI